MIQNNNEEDMHNITNKKYWDSYYASGAACNEPSLFAQFIINRIKKDKALVELGCGNGRDSLFFSDNDLSVIAIDLSEKAIEFLKPYSKPNISFVCGDFVNMDYRKFGEIGSFYSRFTIHALKEKQQNQLIENVYNSLCSEGLFFIETRSILDDLYGKGEKTGEKDEYIYRGHYRRFINKCDLEEVLLNQGFIIEFSKEDKEFAPYEDTNPIVLRIIAKKP